MLQHQRLVRVAPAAALLLSLSATGCADFALVEVGAEYVDPFELERSYLLSPDALSECPRGRVSLEPGDDADSATVDFTPVAGACIVDVRVTGALLLSEGAVDDYATQLEGRGNVGALRGVDVEVRTLSVEDGEGEPIDLTIHSLDVAVEGERVLGDLEVQAMHDGEVPRVTLPQPLVGRFVVALQERHELRTDLRLRMVLRNPDRNIPNQLSLYAELQPIALVDLFSAI